MNYIGLKFILERSFLQIIVTEMEAKHIVDGFLQGSLKPRIGSSTVSQDIGGGSWAVNTASIVAIHTVPIEQQVAPTGQVFRSGIIPR